MYYIFLSHMNCQFKKIDGTKQMLEWCLTLFHMGIRNKKDCKVKNFQVWVPHDNFE